MVGSPAEVILPSDIGVSPCPCTAVYCGACAVPTTVVFTRVDPDWVPVTVKPVDPASTWVAAIVPATSVSPAETWSVVNGAKVSPAAIEWAAAGATGVKVYQGGAARQHGVIGCVVSVVAIFAGALLL